MATSLSLLMAQINPRMGAITVNAAKIIDIIQAQQEHYDLIIFPELALCGYPPDDLLLHQAFYTEIDAALQNIAAASKTAHVILGHPWLEAGRRYNAASVFAQGQRIALYHKQRLPNYGVFDEQRYFSAGEAKPCLINIKEHRLGLCICEDLWQQGPMEALIAEKADIIVCINASPFDNKKYDQRVALLQHYARQGPALIYVNLVGAQDELVFDGQSLALNAQGEICARAPAFCEHLQAVEVHGHALKGEISPLLEAEEYIDQALQCGLRDYVEKNGFPGVLLGLSGGIDSALALCLAVDALGAKRVHAVLMPSRYTADFSTDDAKILAENLGVDYTILPIETVFQSILAELAPAFHGQAVDTTEENIQARIRGVFLMALSNKTGKMLLNTSNKSEIAVGYGTLYGDMAGGFSPLKDVLKTKVYALARYRNKKSALIPERILTRPPSAELAPNQTDQDNLPDYAVLDAILIRFMEQRLSAAELIQQGFNPQAVHRVLGLVQRNEYKRYQAPPGTKISPCAFGRDWRYPLSSGFKI
jgi:NAD+ synthase (glutamine-hydrolysing)